MALFQKAAQRITIYSGEREALEVFVSQLKVRRIKGTKLSSVRHADDEWHCIIDCELAEAIYSQEVLPLLYASVETQSFRIMLELDDKSEPARRCPRELLVSFELKAPYTFGNKADNEFIQKLHMSIVQGASLKPATVSYYIMGGGAVTMSIPCLDLQKMDTYLQSEFKNYGIKRFRVKIVDRERASMPELSG